MRRSLMLAMALFVFNCHAQLVVKSAQVRLLPPGMPNTAGYFQIENTGDEPQILVGAGSDIARSVEIHEHIMTAETMKMVHLTELVIPAKETIQFTPGGYHLMIFGLINPLVEGQSVKLYLQTQAGEKIEFVADVARP
ncbi:copper chaperone PCu(A)C [Flavobacterium sp. W21_SRS_FM6]|uniref:copper chaperone PCu(A)C n=1 Tax=Flavobacterium sp. W21_SRS_FM6 TaxID=3240268 RepID=UPI003F8FE30E